MHSQDLINKIKKIPSYEVKYLNEKNIFIKQSDVIEVILKYFNENNLNNVSNFKFIIGD